MRAEIAALPDGEYGFVDWIDGVGEDPEPLRIEVLLRVAGDELSIDFTGTAPQVEASINCPVGLVFAACYCAIKGIAEREIPNCEGYMRPIRINAPEGTIVNPVLPAACGARGVIGYRVYDAIIGALAEVTPDRVIAAGEGGPTLIAFGGYENGRPFVMTEVIWSARGARGPARTGSEGVSEPARQPLEPAGRAARGGPAARGRPVRASSPTRAAPGASAAGSHTCESSGYSPSAPC